MKQLPFYLLVLLITSCTCSDNPEVAKVGQFPIYKKDIEYRNQVIKIYYPKDNRNLGLNQLIKAYTIAQILVNNGHPINEKTLKQEQDRIDRTTLMPEKLNSIKAIFGSDNDAYRRVFVLPTYAESTIYFKFFLNHPKIQARSRSIAEDFLNKARTKPASFSSLAKKKGFSTANFTVSLYQGLEWQMPDSDSLKAPPHAPPPQQNNVPAHIAKKMKDQTKTQQSEEGKRWIKDIIKPLKKGEVSTRVIDLKERWLVVRYLHPASDAKETYQMEGVSFPKEDYSEWLKAEKEKVVVEQ